MSPLVYFFIGLAWLSFVSKGLSFRGMGLPVSLPSSIIAATALIIALIRLIAVRRKQDRFSLKTLAGSGWFYPLLGLLLLIYLISDARLHKWHFILDKGDLASFWIYFPLMTLGAYLAERYRQSERFIFFLLLAAQVYLAWKFLMVSGGYPLYRDDHPSFLYRFHLFKEVFPEFMFYNPLWNGGYISTEIISSGLLSLSFPAYPLMLIWSPETIYTPFLAGIFIFLIPFIVYLSIRRTGGGKLEAGIGGLLSLGVNRYIFLNILTYGTAPSVFISFMVVPLMLLLYDIIVHEKRGLLRWLLLVIILNLTFFWPAAVLILAPFIIVLFISFRRLTAKTWLFLLSAGLLLTAVNLPWIIKYIRLVALSSYVGREADLSLLRDSGKNFAMLSAYLREMNPVLLVFSFLGLVSLREKEKAAWFIPFIFGYGLMIFISKDYWHKVQMHRMIVPLSFILVPPAAENISRLWKKKDLASALVRGLTAAAIFAGIVSTGKIYGNRGLERYWTMESERARKTIDWIMGIPPGDGRIMFTGTTMHSYGGGHVALLQSLTGREMMAGDFYHFDSEVPDYNLVPKAFQKSKGKFREFLELYNISWIAAHQEKWINRLEADKSIKLVSSLAGKRLYATGIEPSFFIKGSGTVRAEVGGIEVNLSEPSDDVVIKYKYHEALSSPEGAELYPYRAGPKVMLIGIKPGGLTRFRIVLKD